MFTEGIRMDPSELLNVTVTSEGHIAIDGELDMATAPFLEKALVEMTGSLRLDLRKVTFIDAAGVGALVRCSEHCQADGSSFRIEAWSRPVERVLRIVRLYDALTDGASIG